MANKRKRSHAKDSKRISQRARTHKNQIAKYEKLLAENPRDKQAGIWKEKLANLK